MSIDEIDIEDISISNNRTINITSLPDECNKFAKPRNIKDLKPNRPVSMVSDPILEERPKLSWRNCKIFDSEFNLETEDIK